jgi:hypothetical protein
VAAPEDQDQKAEPRTNSAAAEVVAEAIAAIRDDPTSRPAANAIERAWSGQGFDVDRAIQEIEVAAEDDAKDET